MNSQTSDKKVNKLWTPQPRQFEFQRRWEEEALYGGAAGGGKSEALVIEALKQIHIPHYRGIIFRTSVPELRELIEKSEIYYSQIKGSVFNSTTHTWRFKSGAKVIFGSINNERAKYKYQGQAFDFIGFDELTQFTRSQYEYLSSRNRPTGPGTRVYRRATANPGGIGHGWVKDRFVTPAPPGTTITETVPIVHPDGHVEQGKLHRIFIPAKVFDNQKLIQNDPGYITRLAALPEAERNALLYGDWDSFSGQVFKEWRNNPENYTNRRWTHVINPFEIPEHWRIWRSFDMGYSKPFSVGWFAVDTNGKIYRIRELYGCTGTPDVGVCMYAGDIAKKIKEIENYDPLLKGKHIAGVADPAIFAEAGGESVAAMMEKQGVFFDKGDHTRLAGKMQFHYRLAFDANGECMFQVFNTCKDFIRTIPTLTYSETNVEDVDTRLEDHIYDETRYLFMTNPISPRINAASKRPAEDPFDLYNQQPFNFYSV